jgi:1-phosphofructokinase family hexose kinase
MRGESAVLTAGGKGINVARVIRTFNESATLAVLIGEQDAEVYKNLLKDEGADFIATTHPGIVRVATIIFESDNPTSTIINERGSEVSAKDWSAFVAEIAKNVKSGEIVSCMGSFPNGVNQKSIEELVNVIHSVGGKIIFDSSPEYLNFALGAGVDIVSPNLDEAESLLQGKSADLFTGDLTNAQERAEKAAKALLEKGAEVAFVTTGAAGVAVATEHSLDFVHGVKINLVSAVGAGDSFVAGVMMKYDEYRKAKLDFNWRDIAAFGAATASASCEESLSGGMNVARALDLYDQILISEGAA